MRVTLGYDVRTDENVLIATADHGGQLVVLATNEEQRIVATARERGEGRHEPIRPLFRTENRAFLQELAAELIRKGFGPEPKPENNAVRDHLSDAIAVRDRLLAMAESRS